MCKICTTQFADDGRRRPTADRWTPVRSAGSAKPAASQCMVPAQPGLAVRNGLPALGLNMKEDSMKGL